MKFKKRYEKNAGFIVFFSGHRRVEIAQKGFAEWKLQEVMYKLKRSSQEALK